MSVSAQTKPPVLHFPSHISCNHLEKIVTARRTEGRRLAIRRALNLDFYDLAQVLDFFCEEEDEQRQLRFGKIETDQ